jgi:hypothetical protein
MRQSYLQALVAAAVLQGAAAAQEPEPAPFFNRPHLSLGGGDFSYREHHFELAPGLKSRFEEPVISTGFGWDFIFAGHNALTTDFDFFQTDRGTERWKDSGTLVQEDRLNVRRFSLALGYLYSTWDRSQPPESLSGPSRLLRFGFGVSAYYRRQAFRRDEFTDFTTSPPTSSDEVVNETFDMVGVETGLTLEFGPRNIAAAFLRARGGGGYVGVLNDGLEPLVKKEDARIDTGGVQGTVEVGLVSQFARHVELRAGYRYHRMEVFESRRTVNAVDPVLGPVVISIELPDNTTEMHMLFVEAAFPF